MEAAIRHGLANYVNFQGRTPRDLFWWWVLAVFILMVVLGIIDAVLMGSSDAKPLTTLASLALLLPNIGMGVRRLHDTGRSGWWILIGFIPLIGLLVLIWFYIQPPAADPA